MANKLYTDSDLRTANQMIREAYLDFVASEKRFLSAVKQGWEIQYKLNEQTINMGVDNDNTYIYKP